jgi:hypothetical protein
MAFESESPITSQELVELMELEMVARGETFDDTVRFIRRRVTALKAGEPYVSPVRTPAGLSMEARLSALETEVKRLRQVIENGQKNG